MMMAHSVQKLYLKYQGYPWGGYHPSPGLLIAVAPRYRYCSGATFTVAVAPLLLAESSGDSSAATLFSCFLALFATATFKKEN